MSNTIQFKDNKILFDGNQIAFDPNCCCGCTCFDGTSNSFQASGSQTISLKTVISGLPPSFTRWIYKAGIFGREWAQYVVTGADSLNGTYYMTVPQTSAGCPDYTVLTTATLASISLDVDEAYYYQSYGGTCPSAVLDSYTRTLSATSSFGASGGGTGSDTGFSAILLDAFYSSFILSRESYGNIFLSQTPGISCGGTGWASNGIKDILADSNGVEVPGCNVSEASCTRASGCADIGDIEVTLELI